MPKKREQLATSRWDKIKTWAPLVLSLIAILGIVSGLIGLGSYLEIVRQHDSAIKEYAQKFKTLENAQAIFDLDKKLTKEMYEQRERIVAIEVTLRMNRSDAPSVATTTLPRPTAGKQR